MTGALQWREGLRLGQPLFFTRPGRGSRPGNWPLSLRPRLTGSAVPGTTDSQPASGQVSPSSTWQVFSADRHDNRRFRRSPTAEAQAREPARLPRAGQPGAAAARPLQPGGELGHESRVLAAAVASGPTGRPPPTRTESADSVTVTVTCGGPELRLSPSPGPGLWRRLGPAAGTRSLSRVTCSHVVHGVTVTVTVTGGPPPPGGRRRPRRLGPVPGRRPGPVRVRRVVAERKT